MMKNGRNSKNYKSRRIMKKEKKKKKILMMNTKLKILNKIKQL